MSTRVCERNSVFVQFVCDVGLVLCNHAVVQPSVRKCNLCATCVEVPKAFGTSKRKWNFQSFFCARSLEIREGGKICEGGNFEIAITDARLPNLGKS